MCILVSASDQATAAPEAPAPMIRTSTGWFILVPCCRSGARASANPEPRDSGFDASHRPGMTTASSTHHPHWQRADAADEIRIEALHWPGNLEAQIALQNLLPENAELLLGEAVADAAMDAG